MRSLFLLALCSVAILGLVHATDYQPIAAHYEGTSLNLWSFGLSSAATRTAGIAYTPAVIVPGTTTTGPDGETGEIQNLKCGAADCPDVFSSVTSSIWTTRVSLLASWSPSDNNATYDSLAEMDQVHYLNSSGLGYQYRRVASNGDRIITGTTSATTAKRGNYNEAAMYYFGFGLDSFGTVENAVYKIAGGPVILKNVGTHMVKEYIVTPPAAGTDMSGWARFSDIPAEWLSDPSVTQTDDQIYEYGFYATAATPPPVAASSSLLPSAFALFFALLLVVLF